MPYNPFSGWRITGTWADHMSYSLGGEDYPLPYGTALPMPAAGILYTEGRPRSGGEFQCGLVGSAGRRQILMLDTPIRDVVAVVFQHLSVFGGRGKHYEEGESGGRSGASIVVDGVVQERGGDIHLHIHCLTASGQRRKFTDYFGGTKPASSGATAIPVPVIDSIEDDAMPTMYIHPNGAALLAWPDRTIQMNDQQATWGVNQFELVRCKSPEEYQSIIDWAESYRIWKLQTYPGLVTAAAPEGLAAEIASHLKIEIPEGVNVEAAVHAAFGKVFRLPA